MLEKLTFTGVDERTPIQELGEMVKEYPQVEFAALMGRENGVGGNPIFPPFTVLSRMGEIRANSALHLCGSYARSALSVEWDLFPDNLRLCHRFGRIQVNLHGDSYDPDRIEVTSEGIVRLAEMVDCESVIVQHRADWDSVPVDHPKVEYLFDLSEGAGVEAFGNWPVPPADRRVGYAGGIGPHNIDRAMAFVNQHPGARMWLDMESQVRTDCWFDLDKVRAVCRVAFEGQ